MLRLFIKPRIFTDKEKQKHIREVSAMCLSRPQKLCNFLEWREYKIVYKRYASLFFITCVDRTDNELITLEVIHQFVEVLDRYFGNVVGFWPFDLWYDEGSSSIYLLETIHPNKKAGQRYRVAAMTVSTGIARDSSHSCQNPLPASSTD
jgi:hypothetical protein